MTPTQHNSPADYYFGFLEHLNADSKLDLIVKLSQSLKHQTRESEISLRALFGAYQSNETAEEIIDGIRTSRVSNRATEQL